MPRFSCSVIVEAVVRLRAEQHDFLEMVELAELMEPGRTRSLIGREGAAFVSFVIHIELFFVEIEDRGYPLEHGPPEQ